MADLLLGDIAAAPFAAFALVGLLVAALALVVHNRHPLRVAAVTGAALGLLATGALIPG